MYRIPQAHEAAVALPLTRRIDGRQPRDLVEIAPEEPRLSEAEIMQQVARELAAVTARD